MIVFIRISLFTAALLPWAWMQNLAPHSEQDADTAQAEKRAAENREVLSLLPEADSKRILQARCVDCHSLARVSAGQKSLKSWSNTLQVMIVNGASLKEEEIAPLAEYLAANFGLAVNVNKASAAELAKVPLLNEKLANAIVTYREKNGLFTSVDELLKVPGWPENVLPRVRPRLTVGVVPKKPE